MHTPEHRKRRPVGRPRKAAKPGTTVGVTLRITAGLKARLETAATASGRTVSKEAESRLDSSFATQDLLLNVLELSFGGGIGAVVAVVGRAMFDTAQTCAIIELMAAPGKLSQALNAPTPHTFAEMVKAANLALKALAPAGEIERPLLPFTADSPAAESLRLLQEQTAAAVVKPIIDAVCGEGITAELQAWGAAVRNLAEKGAAISASAAKAASN